MDSPPNPSLKRCPNCPHRLSDFGSHNPTQTVASSSPSKGHASTGSTAEAPEPAAEDSKTVVSESSALNPLAASEDLLYMSSCRFSNISDSMIADDGSSRPGSRTSIESIMIGKLHPYRADDQEEPTHIERRKHHSGILTPEEEKEVIEAAITSWSVAGKLHEAIKAEDIAAAAVRTANRQKSPSLNSDGSGESDELEEDPWVVKATKHIDNCPGCPRREKTYHQTTPEAVTPGKETQGETETQESTQPEETERPTSASSQKPDHSDSNNFSHYSFYTEDDDDDYETHQEAWKLGAQMTFALDHLRACTNCWSVFDQVPSTKKQLESIQQIVVAELSRAPEISREELSHDELEAALSEEISAWKKHKEFIIEYREQAHYQMINVAADGEIPEVDCVFRLALEHLKTCASCPGELVAPEFAPSWTQRLESGQECRTPSPKGLGEQFDGPNSPVASTSLTMSPPRRPSILDSLCSCCQSSRPATPNSQLQPSNPHREPTPVSLLRFPYETGREAPITLRDYSPEEDRRRTPPNLRRYTSDFDYHRCTCVVCGGYPFDLSSSSFYYDSDTGSHYSQSSSQYLRTGTRSPRSSTPTFTPPPGSFLRPVFNGTYPPRSPGRTPSPPDSALTDPELKHSSCRYSRSPGRSPSPPLRRRCSIGLPQVGSPRPRRSMPTAAKDLNTHTDGKSDSIYKEDKRG
jgi:hypothetical protein